MTKGPTNTARAHKCRVLPSVLNADLSALGAELNRVPSADGIHLDVMDNHFVPNLTLGLPVVASVRASTSRFLDVHLMIDDPDRWAPGYAELGVESVTVHAEAAKAPIRLARELRALGARAGLALNPATSISAYADLLSEFDMILLMTVEPGFGGQPFLPQVLPKLAATRKLIKATGQEIWLQVDGGISADTIEQAAAAGADTFVAGSAVFSAPDPDLMVQRLQELVSGK